MSSASVRSRSPLSSAFRISWASSANAECSSMSSAIGSTPLQPQYSHISADPVPSPTRPVAAELLVVAAAVHDVGPGQVAEWRAEDVHESGEGPQGEESEGGQGVELEPERGVRHQRRVWVEGKERPEP